MEAKSDQRKKLDDLPGGNDEFWKHAETNLYKIKEHKCNHEFAHSRIKEGISAECIRCNIGFVLSPGMEIKGKHIYLYGSLVI